jgi:hypothetical protein
MNLEQLMNAHRPLLFSRMPRMLRDNGMMAGNLQHEFRYFEGAHTHPVPVSAQRWKVALQTSRILRKQRTQ